MQQVCFYLWLSNFIEIPGPGEYVAPSEFGHYESKRKYSILLTTDFVAPKFGGVETHGYQLAQCLIERGHKVVMVSNMYNFAREGVRIMANGLKVYHLPLLPVLRNDVSFFCPLSILPLLR